MPDRFYILDGPKDVPIVISEVIETPFRYEGYSYPDELANTRWGSQWVESGTALEGTE